MQTLDFPRYDTKLDRGMLIKYWLRGIVTSKYRNRLAVRNLPEVVAQVMKRCISTRDGKILLIKNAKAACSTAAQLLVHYDLGSFEDISKLHGSRKVRQGINYAKDHIAVLNDPASFKFTTVRDPFARTLSAFAMFFVPGGADVLEREDDEEDGRRRESGMWTLGYEPDGSVSRNFDIFLDYLEQCFAVDEAHVNPHWRPQIYTTAYGFITYDHIARVETLRRDLETIQDKIGHRFPGMDKPEGPQFNRSRVDVKSLLKVTDAQRRKVRDLFAADYEAFGY